MIGIAKLEKFIVACAVLCLSACGADSGGSENNEANQAGVEENSAQGAANYALVVSGEAPECGDSNKDQLAYFTTEDAFKHCDGSSWVSIDVRGTGGADGQDGAAGITVEKQWEYSTSTYSDQDDMLTEAPLGFAYVGRIELTLFSDGSKLIVVSGISSYYTEDNGGDLKHNYADYSFVSLIPPTKKTVSRQSKIHIFAETVLLIDIGPYEGTEETVVVKVGASADGDITNDTLLEFELGEYL